MLLLTAATRNTAPDRAVKPQLLLHHAKTLIICALSNCRLHCTTQLGAASLLCCIVKQRQQQLWLLPA
jgi:hypothetical protein